MHVAICSNMFDSYDFSCLRMFSKNAFDMILQMNFFLWVLFNSFFFTLISFSMLKFLTQTRLYLCLYKYVSTLLFGIYCFLLVKYNSLCAKEEKKKMHGTGPTSSTPTPFLFIYFSIYFFYLFNYFLFMLLF